MKNRRTPRGGATNTIATPLLFVLPFFLAGALSCSLAALPSDPADGLLRETAALLREVREFERTLGIESGGALAGTVRERPARSVLWLWLQRRGTLAVRAPIDIFLGLGFSAVKEDVPLSAPYDVHGYSLYFRRENQFGDSSSVITLDFAKQPLLRKIEVILHEDLHDDKNFALGWENEESLVTPLGMLAAVKFFEAKEDGGNAGKMEAAIREKRILARELNDFACHALDLFRTIQTLDKARDKVARLLSEEGRFPAYYRFYRGDLKDQNPTLALEAKISHDLAYYGNFERIVSLHERRRDLKALIGDLKKIPRDAGRGELENYLDALQGETPSEGRAPVGRRHGERVHDEPDQAVMAGERDRLQKLPAAQLGEGAFE